LDCPNIAVLVLDDEITKIEIVRERFLDQSVVAVVLVFALECALPCIQFPDTRGL